MDALRKFVSIFSFLLCICMHDFDSTRNNQNLLTKSMFLRTNLHTTPPLPPTLGRAYLFDQCVNVTVGPAEDRLLITGLHSVCDIFCKRCKGMVGWTYAKAYESSQKYKEGKFIIEKINLHLEESDYYDVSHPAGERTDRWRKRSMSWGSEKSITSSPGSGKDMVYEYNPNSPFSTLSPRQRARSISTGGYAIGSPSVAPKTNKLSRNLPEPPLL
mmetsp:Transcript_22698/g.30021  ORF Transcript_22698/g.30021 Transcript_22698/m.30021 type:complete len:215 (+) Transcript_22698:1059-1703(+)